MATFISQLNKTKKLTMIKLGDFLGNGICEIEICLEVGEGCA